MTPIVALGVIGVIVVGLIIAIVIISKRGGSSNPSSIMSSAPQQPAQQNTSGAPHPLTAEAEAQMQQHIAQAYQLVMDKGAQQFAVDLQATSKRLGEQISRLTTTVIERELDEYHKSLSEARLAATQMLTKVTEAVEAQRQSMEATLAGEVEIEKAKLLAKFDDKMSDIVSSYIIEALGQGIDLGSQAQFVINTLETHKEELKEELRSDV